MEHFSDFIQACRTGNESVIQNLLSQHPSFLEIPDKKHGWTALYRTIMCGNIEASYFLISSGANCNVKDSEGFSLLSQAVSNLRIKEAKILLQNNANVNDIQPGRFYLDGNTCLHVATSKDSNELVDLLLNSGADPNIKNSVNGKTPLHVACEANSVQLIQTLLNSNANPGLKDSLGRPASELCKPELKDLFHSYYRSNSYKSQRNSPLSFPLLESLDMIPSIPLESFSLNLSPIATKADPEKQNTTCIESEKNEARHVKAFSFGGGSPGLFLWLESVRLDFLYEVLMCSGFDDIDQIVSQMRRNLGITEEMLEGIGIEKPGHRKRLLAALDEEVRVSRVGRRHRQTQSNPLKCCYLVDSSQSAVLSAPDLKNWLELVRYSQYYKNFCEAGYEDLEHNLCLMNSKWPINENVLQNDVKILSQTHRHKLISKFKAESFGFDSMKKAKKTEPLVDRHNVSAACEFCIVM